MHDTCRFLANICIIHFTNSTRKAIFVICRAGGRRSLGVMDLYELPDYDAHELVLLGHDSATGLRSIIALHSSALGPAAGGCRLWAYRTTAEAVADALRLSRGMSYKNAMAGLRFGGGKAVILAATRQV